MSYDIVRSSLRERNVWLLVLETYGINVWCAAGKGTFGTGELVRRLQAVRLNEIVSHRQLLLPILAAAGVSAHEVKRRSGFTVDYAAIRASDLPAFLDNG
jgi:acetyl-CoA decarbonylase/synthase complex subunit gamma